LLRQGDYAATHKVLTDTIQQARRKLSDDHPLTVVLTNNLAEVLRLEGDLDSARAVGEQAVEASRQRRVSSAGLAVFKVQDCARFVGAIGVGQAADKARDHIKSKIAYCNPFNFIDFDAVNADVALVFAKLSAIKYIEYLVAFRIVWCPIVDQ